MKRYIPAFVVFAIVACIVAGLLPHKPAPGEADLTDFGKLPVLVGGRIQPLDTTAANSLLIIHGRQSIRLENGKQLDSIRWLADVLFNAPVADQYPAFVIDNPEVLGLFGWQQDTSRKFFSYNDLSPFLDRIEEQGTQAEDPKIKSSERTPYQAAIAKLNNSVGLYRRLKSSIQPEPTDDFAAEVREFARTVADGRQAVRLKSTGKPFDQKTFDSYSKSQERYNIVADQAYIRPLPPESTAVLVEWTSTGVSLLSLSSADHLNPLLAGYAEIASAWRAGETARFERGTADLAARFAQTLPKETGKASFERIFNRLQPFYNCSILYLIVFLLACASWLFLPDCFQRSAVWLLVISFVLHTFGLAARMYIQGRPPVTNLYSSAIFIGWGTVIICFVLERIGRNGIGSACAGLIGFVTLVIAHNLAANGDTLEMLVAVLDTNIWLATHVVVVTLGYCAMFLAGVLAIFYVLLGVFTPNLKKDLARSLSGMVYGVTCFATLFSFVGTVLGGIWADQSWGRFWGWDPKENGALLIVLWCAITLHARWGGYIRQRGLICMALFGNVVTSFSWFGVNMLGVGLHSYGFMEKAFPWLVGFGVSQIALIALARLPLANWKSFAKEAAPAA
jgi:ABC-type transport system involved in cytochrome c biogenesis permease subunit